MQSSVAFFFVCALVGTVLSAGTEQQKTLPVNVALQGGDFTAYVSVNVGTPAQSVNFNLDLFSTSSYIVDKDAKVKCDAKPSLFDYGKSSSFKLLKNYTEKYDSNFLVEDVVQFASSTPTKRQFNLTDYYPSDWACNSYNGALGLGLVSQSESLISNTLKDYQNQVLTISPTSDKKASPPQLSLTLGGQDTTQCGSEWTEAKCSATSEFTYPACTFGVNGYSFGSYTVKRSYTYAYAALSLQAFTYVPKDVYSQILRGVTYDASKGGIPCTSNPDLSIFIDKKQFTLSAKQYTGPSVGNGYCEFLIQNGFSYGLQENLFVLPLGFFANNCQSLDYAKQTMSLAVAK